MPRLTPPVRALSLPFLLAAAAVLASAPASVRADPPAAAESNARAHARRAFQRFAEEWMQKMERVEERNRSNPAPERDGGCEHATYRGYGPDFTVELRPTGYARAPYVGILRYSEQLYRCSDGVPESCSVASTTRVTEIFRYQNGRWVH